MPSLRAVIEEQALTLTGFRLPGVDFTQPVGDPGLFGPESALWELHRDVTTMLCGGVGSMLLQMLHPLALAGIWDHSVYREDLLGRLLRTNQFIFATSFGSRVTAERMVVRINAIHAHVSGRAADGRPYSARDPHLVTWVHVAQVVTFVEAYRRYVDANAPGEWVDRYYAEAAVLATALGGRDVPRSRAEIEVYLERMRPELVCDDRTRELSGVLLAASPSPGLRPLSRLYMRAGIDLLPEWATQQLGLRQSRVERMAVRTAMRGVTSLVRHSVRDGAWHRAMRRAAVVPAADPAPLAEASA